MWNSNLHYNLIQQGAGKYEESKVSSQGTESSQEETGSIEPWSRIFDKAEKRHETLMNEYEGNGDSENVARVKAENALLPVYRKELRKVLLENLQWMRAMKKDPTFKKVMETQKELKDTEGFDWLESTELAIDKRKFLLNRLCAKSPFHKIKTSSTMNVIEFFSRTSVLLRFNKNCKQPNFIKVWFINDFFCLSNRCVFDSFCYWFLMKFLKRYLFSGFSASNY